MTVPLLCMTVHDHAVDCVQGIKLFRNLLSARNQGFLRVKRETLFTVILSNVAMSSSAEHWDVTVH